MGDIRRTASPFATGPEKSRGTRAVALGLTVAAHAAALAALLWTWVRPAPPSPPEPAAQAPGPPAHFIQPQVPHVVTPAVTLTAVPVDDKSDLLTGAQLAGA